MFKVILIVVIAWFVLRAVRNLVIAIAAPRDAPGDDRRIPRQDKRGGGRRRDARPDDDRNVTDAVWKDIS